MKVETSQVISQIAVGIGLATILWATVVAGVEKKKLRQVAPQLSGWSESFVQFTARYLTPKQKIIFFVCMGSAVVLAIVRYLVSR